MAADTAPALAAYRYETEAAVATVRALEAVGRGAVHPARMDLVYEMCFLRIYAGWESLLEDVFVRYLCRHTRIAGGPVPLVANQGSYSPNINAARTRLLAGKSFLLWHDPKRVVKLSQSYFQAGPHESLLLSATSEIERLGAIRHRIVHRHADAKNKFDTATMHFITKKVRGARAGAFLRTWNTAQGVPMRWLDVFHARFDKLAMQLCS